MREKVNARDTQWDTLQEMGFIDDAIAGLSHKERALWLERYLDACLKRADWGLVDGQKVINYIEREMITFRMLALAGRP